MPRRTDIQKILLLGSGPIVIGQACEFDYSGTQACKVLMDEGFEVVLVNSNPATIMTDPVLSHRTYIEPLVPEVVARVIADERPDALLPTLGGQTALNLAVALTEDGTLHEYGVELIGADYATIRRAEARDEFRAAIASIGLRVPESAVVNSVAEARAALAGSSGEHQNGGSDGLLRLPLIIRPSFTLGGHGGGVANTDQEFEDVVQAGLDASPTHQVLLEESVIGWKEFELEVMRDSKDNVVIVCSIENIDPMGVHTGDSITVAPQQTLSDAQYRRLREAAPAIVRAIGLESGGCNIQFAYSPDTDELVVIEMNPRVSRSSALASKATGFPIAKIAAKLAVGYTLDELISSPLSAAVGCSELTIDHVAVKTPRWAFEKFPLADARLTTHMKSVGENMALGSTFKEAFQKSMRSRELDVAPDFPVDNGALVAMIATPSAERYDLILEAYRRNVTLEAIFAVTLIDKWFLRELWEIVEAEEHLRSFYPRGGLSTLPTEDLWRAKRLGFSDPYIAKFLGTSEAEVRTRRKADGVVPVYRAVDACATQVEAYTPYFYSTYEKEKKTLSRSGRESVIILGSGPNRIGQGIEFDYCCVHAVQELRELGYEAIMVNCNPETVSTDYDTSDRLYFEPLTFEDVLNIIESENPKGVVVQFGGQTPLKIAERLAAAGVPILGTSQEAIDLAEDREHFGAVLERLGLKAPPYGTVRNADEALAVAERIGYPVLVRPSYVLGGRAMEIVYDEEGLQHYLTTAVKASPRHPVLIDRFLEHATEIDVDALCDGEDVYIGAVMQHVEEAGVHSGDSACVIPPVSIGDEVVRRIEDQTAALARELGVIGLMNVQYAVQQSDHGGASIYVLEVNPRSSRTVPFVSKATGVSLARIATRVIVGQKLRDLGLPGWEGSLRAGRIPCRRDLQHVAVKEAVLPFARFPGVDTTLGPEMKSTGEVMGVGASFPDAFAKASLAAGDRLPEEGAIFMSIADADKDAAILMALVLSTLGFRILATAGTHRALTLNGISSEAVLKHTEGVALRAAAIARAGSNAEGASSGTEESGPWGAAEESPAVDKRVSTDVDPFATIVDLIEAGEIDLVINIPRGRGARADGYEIRRAALRRGVPTMTSAAAAHAAVQAIAAARRNRTVTVTCLQDLHGRLLQGDDGAADAVLGAAE